MSIVHHIGYQLQILTQRSLIFNLHWRMT